MVVKFNQGVYAVILGVGIRREYKLGTINQAIKPAANQRDKLQQRHLDQKNLLFLQIIQIAH